VAFGEVAEGRFVRGFSGITRQDGRRRVRIQADVDERTANAEQVVQSLERSFLPELSRKYTDIQVLIDGQRKRISESLASLVSAAAICIVLAYVVLGAGMKSYVQPLILMTAVPLGLAGAVVGHAILGRDLSLMSVFGMTSVAGIVVNDALVLVDEVNRNLAGGMKVQEAVARGSESRVIAVLLTALTNVVGMAPLLAERSSQAVTLIPIAISVAFGLAFAMILTLFIVPALFVAVNDVRRFVRWVWVGGYYPTPETVEPSCPTTLLPTM
jgi:multidrug efflux pump subunit AcrB